ncbi:MULTISPECIES: transporter substrate-binding domain-containing protein [Thalassospira]|uniref:Amino acid ABC transporter substrate-binding protein n=1 Tax=Thalassospira xiamenensis TaxID=220697 RepID=A0A367WZU4_9PROT|nr:MULTISPECIES: transporter substrate-binding domain-containing protein [Thalassospira]KZB55649.1 amino acid ABC transporter substrate-binding protein [Thalassospira xiamenensis]MAZ32216.1 amino acid ABC transporter substrate-binding protein [Thalassospira sp.]MCH2276377.1 transporter substrate-binding domain-containing protein [Thalassospira sp.]RCK46956.1 amino acid ABC transporter substrate-binding protein [Thalassospira xiamenensis]
MNKFLKSTIAAIAMIAAPLAGASAGALDTIKEAGVLKVAVPQDFPPFGTVGADMQPKGYDIDMAALIADDLGVKLELVPVASSNRIPYLTTGKVDLVISSLGKNPDREKVIDFTDPYAPFYNGVFGPADIAVKGAEDLAGHSVGVTRGAIEDLELTKIAPADLEIKRYEDNNGTISAFLSGQVDLIATGNVTAAAIIERNPPRKPEPKFLIKNSPCYVGLNKEEDAFKARVNEIIAASIADGRLNAIAEKWLGIPLPEKL